MSRISRSAAQPGQPLLRVVQRQGGAHRAELLGRVGVPQHDLQLPPPTRLPVPPSPSPCTGGQPRRHRRQFQHPVQHVDRVRQVRAALEQRDHVEHRRRAAAHGEGRQPVDGGDVGRGAGEADHVTVTGRHAEPALDPADRPHGRQHLGRLCGQLAAGLGLTQRTFVHRAVLAHLQRRGVEAERLGLPDQVLQLPERLPARARTGQRVLDQAQVGEEGGAAGVGQVGVAQPGGADAFRQEKQECAIRLLGGPCADLREEFGVLGLGGLQREREARTRRRGRGVDGEGTADPGGGVLQRTQRVVGVDHRRVPGHLGGHGRVAVPVRADPAAEPQARGGHRRRAGAGPWHRAAGLVECPVERRGHAEQGVVEHGHDRADLVHRPDRLDPQRRGEPQQADLLAQPPLHLGGLRRGRSLVQGLDEHRHPAQRRGHRAAAGLGGVGGEHRLHPQPRQQPGEPGGVGAELGHRGGQRLAPWPPAPRPPPHSPFTVPLRLRQVRLAAQHAHPVPFLGQVGQVEIDRECLGDQFGAVQRPARDQCRDLVAGQVGLVPRRILPGRDDRAAQPLHVVEQVLAAGFADHLAEQVTEEPDIPAQRDRQLLPVGLPAHCDQPSAGQFRGRGCQVRR